MKIRARPVAKFLLIALAIGSFTVRGENEPLKESVVVVGNGVRAPGAVSYSKDMTITTALNAVGGVSWYEQRVYVVRCGKSSQVDYNAIQRDPKKDIALKAWDIVVLK